MFVIKAIRSSYCRRRAPMHLPTLTAGAISFGLLPTNFSACKNTFFERIGKILIQSIINLTKTIQCIVYIFNTAESRGKCPMHSLSTKILLNIRIYIF